MKESDLLPEVEYIHRINRLKLRVGGSLSDLDPGHIDPEAIKAVDAVVEKIASNGHEKIKIIVDRLVKSWEDIKKDLTFSEPKKLDTVFFLAHDVKDMAALCGFDLIKDFAESLRDYVEKADLSIFACRVIIQAHIDTIAIATRDGILNNSEILDKNNIMAIQLWSSIREAIVKYS